MSVLFLLIPLSVLLAGGFLAAFIWAVRSGQYEDTCTPSLRVLWDDRSPAGPLRPSRNGPAILTEASAPDPAIHPPALARVTAEPGEAKCRNRPTRIPRS